MSPPKIHFICSSDPDRQAPHAIMPALVLAAAGHDVECLCLGSVSRQHFASPIATLPTISLGTGRGWLGGIALQLRIFRAIVARRFSGTRAIFYVSSSAVTPAAWLALLGVRRDRIIYHTQDFLEPGRHPLWEFFERKFARRAGRVICNEPNRARCLASLYGLSQMPEVVRTALPRAWPVPQRDPDLRAQLLRRAGRDDGDDTRLILNAGSFSSARCTRELIDALRFLPNCYVLLLTDCDPADATFQAGRAQLRKSGLINRVLFLPHLPFEELLTHAACCDIGMLLYPNDGIGNYYQAPGRLTEYLGAGLPIVTSNFPGLDGLVRRHDLGRTCEPTSPRAIADAIEDLGARPETFRAADRKRLHALAKSELAYERDAPWLHDIIRRCVGTTSPESNASFRTESLTDPS